MGHQPDHREQILGGWTRGSDVIRDGDGWEVF